MKLLTRLLLGALSLALHLVAVLLFTGLASLAYSHWTAERFEPGEEPPGRFPLVTRSGSDYALLRWGERPIVTGKASDRGYRLTARRGSFTLDPISGFVPRVDFEVLDDDGTEQRIAVTWWDDDYQTHSRYRTDGTSVEPEYFRVWGAGTVFAGLLPGIVGAWLAGRAVRRLWRARGAAPT